MRKYQRLQATATAGNVSKDFTSEFTGNKPWQILYGQVVLTTDATVANRRVLLKILDSTGAVVFDTHAGAVVAASATAQHHEFLQGIYRETSFVGSALQVPIGHDFIIPAGWTLRISIENGVAGDSYTAQFMAVEHV